MARPARETPSPSPLVPAIVRYARGRGVDVELLLARMSLPDGVEALEEAPITAPGLNELIAAVAGAVGEPFLALRLPADLPFRGYPLPELAARASATLRLALARLARYSALLHPALGFRLEETGDESRWRVSTAGHARGLGRHLHEYGLALGLGHCRPPGGPAPAVKRVWFIHARPRDIEPLQRFFGTPELAFGEVDNGWAVETTVLEAPTLTADPRLLVTADRFAEAALRERPAAGSLLALVATELRQLLPERASIDGAARALHMSPRTLQRRLEAEGTRFSELLDDVRQELARAWVTDRSLSLGEVGERLGFSDLASFSRAFKRWTGKPPGTWRRG